MRINPISQFLACSCLLAGATTSVMLASPVEYTVTADLASIATQSGYIDLQFNPSGQSGDQSATATVSDALVTSTLDGSPNITGSVSGSLGPTTSLTFQNGPGSPNDYLQQVSLFGPSLTFDLTLDGPMIEGPNGQGGGTSFYLSFLDPNGNDLLSIPNDPSGSAGYVTINPDGSLTVTDGPDVTFTLASSSSPGTVPEPSSWTLLSAGLVALAGFACRRAFLQRPQSAL